jgi:two-component system sensor histidine kinase UhpB
LGDVESEVKRRLARELHDSVARSLTMMVVDIEHFKLEVAGEHGVVSRMEQLQESTREVLRNLRQVLYDLRDEPAADRGFVQHLRALLGRLEGSTGICSRLRLAAGWPAVLAPATANNLYRIVEEALNNVRLHSAADEVEVRLGTNGRHIVVSVEDNGAAHGVGELRPGMGLMGMRERAVLLGGELHLARGETGMTVVAVVPRPRSPHRARRTFTGRTYLQRTMRVAERTTSVPDKGATS